MSKRQFCRDIALERGEPLEGTGNAPHRGLLLAWPRGKWRTPRWESLDMSAELSAAVHEAAMGGVHVALVDKVGESDTLPQLHAQPESVFADFDNEADLVTAIRNYTNGEVFAGEVDPRATILCCTDSRRDACCAKYGFSTYKALVAAADPTQFNIVQATHLGGCRFAASLIVMPQRQRYGRMTAEQAPALLEAILHNEIFLPAYKGRTDQSEAIQVAEIAALKWAQKNVKEKSNLRVQIEGQSEEPIDGAELSFYAKVAEFKLDICLKAKMFRIQGNCEILSAGTGLNKPRWCVQQLTLAAMNHGISSSGRPDLP